MSVPDHPDQGYYWIVTHKGVEMPEFYMEEEGEVSLSLEYDEEGDVQLLATYGDYELHVLTIHADGTLTRPLMDTHEAYVLGLELDEEGKIKENV